MVVDPKSKAPIVSTYDLRPIGNRPLANSSLHSGLCIIIIKIPSTLVLARSIIVATWRANKESPEKSRLNRSDFPHQSKLFPVFSRHLSRFHLFSRWQYESRMQALCFYLPWQASEQSIDRCFFGHSPNSDLAIVLLYRDDPCYIAMIPECEKSDPILLRMSQTRYMAKHWSRDSGSWNSTPADSKNKQTTSLQHAVKPLLLLVFPKQISSR
jgi:hypothetical protein